MNRSHRLTITAQGLALEVGIGVRHTLGWDDCEAVLRFPDRAEVILGPTTSVVIRAQDWFRGEEALDLIERVLPAGLLVTLPGELEVDPTPYRLSGLATSSGALLVVVIISALFFGVLMIAAGAVDPSPAPTIAGAVLCALAVPFALALRRRLAVPSRWRAAAVVAGRSRVRLDHRLGRLSDGALVVAVVGCPLAGVLVTAGAWFLTHHVGGLFIGLGIGLGLTANVERARRRHR